MARKDTTPLESGDRPDAPIDEQLRSTAAELERVDWQAVDRVSVATAATFAQKLRLAASDVEEDPR